MFLIRIYGGKLAGLPATYTERQEEATSLDITLHDPVMDTDLVLTYSVYEDYPVITRSARLVQKGDQEDPPRKCDECSSGVPGYGL